MLLTITTTHRPATDHGYLLHKHPNRVQTFSVPFGAAHVVYAVSGEECCTAALLLSAWSTQQCLSSSKTGSRT